MKKTIDLLKKHNELTVIEHESFSKEAKKLPTDHQLVILIDLTAPDC